jgi:hypothetical protein
MPDYTGRVATDYTGARSILGRTADGYALWPIAGGPPQQVFPLTQEGWATAWARFQELEGGGAVQKAGPVAGAMAPLGLGGVLSGSFQVFGRGFGAFALTVASVMIPVAILQVILLQALLGPELELLFSGAIPRTEFGLYKELIEEQIPTFIAAGIGFAVGYLFVQAFLTAALVRGGLQGFRGGRPRAGELLGASLSRTPSMAWILFLTILAIFAVALPAAFVLGLVSAPRIEALIFVVAVLAALLLGLFYTRFVFAPAALIAEGMRGTAAIRRSWELTRSRIWPIFGTVLLVLLIGAAANFLMTLIVQAIAQEQRSLSAFWFMTSIGSAVATVVVLPFTTVALVHLYIDARARKENVDPASLEPAPTQS